MNNNLNKRAQCTHLYNPKAEGLGTYDMHYINAYRKNMNLRSFKEDTTIERYAA